jgi:hypothetical protein
MLLPCASSAALQTEKFYDMLGTGSFAALSLGSLLAAKIMPARKVGRLRTATRTLWHADDIR